MTQDLLERLTQWQQDSRFRREVVIKIGGALTSEQNSERITINDYHNSIYSYPIRTVEDLEFSVDTERQKAIASLEERLDELKKIQSVA